MGMLSAGWASMSLHHAHRLVLLSFAGSTTSETITLAVPGDVVPGSERAHISTLGEERLSVCLSQGFLGKQDSPCRRLSPSNALFSWRIKFTPGGTPLTVMISLYRNV